MTDAKLGCTMPTSQKTEERRKQHEALFEQQHDDEDVHAHVHVHVFLRP